MPSLVKMNRSRVILARVIDHGVLGEKRDFALQFGNVLE